MGRRLDEEMVKKLEKQRATLSAEDKFKLYNEDGEITDRTWFWLAHINDAHKRNEDLKNDVEIKKKQYEDAKAKYEKDAKELNEWNERNYNDETRHMEIRVLLEKEIELGEYGK